MTMYMYVERGFYLVCYVHVVVLLIDSTLKEGTGLVYIK